MCLNVTKQKLCSLFTFLDSSVLFKHSFKADTRQNFLTRENVTNYKVVSFCPFVLDLCSFWTYFWEVFTLSLVSKI